MDAKKINQIDFIDGRGMSQADTDDISRYIQRKRHGSYKKPSDSQWPDNGVAENIETYKSRFK